MKNLHEAYTRYRPILTLSELVSRSALSRIRHFSCTLFLIGGGTLLVLPTSVPDATVTLILALTGIAGATWLEQILLYAYHNHYYFYGITSYLRTGDTAAGISYEVAELIHNSENDLVLGFLSKRHGEEILRRTGLDPSAVQHRYVSLTPRSTLSATAIPLEETSLTSLTSFASLLYTRDVTFARILAEQGVTRSLFEGAALFVERSITADKRATRWWSRDSLSKRRPLGRTWSFGVPYLLEKFERPFVTLPTRDALTKNAELFGESTIDAVMLALARSSSANVLLVGEAGSGIHDLVVHLNNQITRGATLDALGISGMVLLDTTRLCAEFREKADLTQAIQSLFEEATRAGGLIIVIEDLHRFIEEGRVVGVEVPALLDPYLANPTLRIIATDTRQGFQQLRVRDRGIIRRFTEIMLDEPTRDICVSLLERVVRDFEKKQDVFFTISAIDQAIVAGERYIVHGVMPEKAILLIEEAVSVALARKVTVISADLINELVTLKTGISVGTISASEREQLLHLEAILGERVIGQHAAIKAVASTMRRARAGMQSSTRPIGSFLFLGPTGVGKTETAKALARTFFGNESALLRFDMSEFSSPDALSRMIGTSDGGGALVEGLTTTPYTVLLFDEFEKAHRSIHDLCLQILDEGIFTAADGQKINVRNTLIIATANAGSDLIIKTVSQRASLATLEPEIINHLIETKQFRPELINRFDDVVIFEPLHHEEQLQVANLFIQALIKRVREQGYELSVTPAFLETLVTTHYTPAFGARPIRRAIQDSIEAVIATKIIAGLEKGSTVVLDAADAAIE